MRAGEMNIHEGCFNWDTSDKPAIESIRLAADERGVVTTRTNQVLFCLEGRMRLTNEHISNHEFAGGKIVFMPSGGEYSYHAMTNVALIIFRIHEPVRLCGNYSIEKLYASQKTSGPYRPQVRHCGILDIVPRIRYFLDGINDIVTDGVRCRNYFDLKIKEFFHLLNIYYTRDDLHDFFYLILSGDAVFSEYVRANRHLFHKVADMADAMRMTPRQFSAKFKSIFGQTAYRWMIEERASAIRHQLTSGDNSVKQIALENGFSTTAQLTKFCKKELGATPTDIRSGEKSQN